MKQSGTQVLDRTFDILEMVAEDKSGISLNDIVLRLKLSKSTVHRILTALCNRGFIEKTPDKIYKLGLKIIEISSVYLNDVELKTEARPFLSDVTKRVGYPVHLAIRDSMNVVYIDKVDVQNNIRIYSQIGKRVPLHCTALGKSLLSDVPEKELMHILDNINFEKFTEKTIISKTKLLSQIEMARLNGWSLDDEEHELGIRCISAPIYDYRGQIIAAISISAPKNMLKRDNDIEMGDYISSIAIKISKRIGYIPKKMEE